MQTDDTLNWVCQYCGVENSVWVDLTIDGKQDFVEDCRICCRPNRVIVVKDYDENVMIESRLIDEQKSDGIERLTNPAALIARQMMER